MTRLDLLELVNDLNMRELGRDRFWTCTVMHNTVIWRAPNGYDEKAVMHQVIKGIPQ